MKTSVIGTRRRRSRRARAAAVQPAAWRRGRRRGAGDARAGGGKAGEGGQTRETRQKFGESPRGRAARRAGEWRPKILVLIADWRRPELRRRQSFAGADPWCACATDRCDSEKIRPFNVVSTRQLTCNRYV